MKEERSGKFTGRQTPRDCTREGGHSSISTRIVSESPALGEQLGKLRPAPANSLDFSHLPIRKQKKEANRGIHGLTVILIAAKNLGICVGDEDPSLRSG